MPSVFGDLFTLPATGVIVQASPGALAKVAQLVQENDLLQQYLHQSSVLEQLTQRRVEPLTFFSVLPRFNYVTGYLSRSSLEGLVTENSIERVWRDGAMNILQAEPGVVPPQGIYTIRVGNKAATFTSTQWTRQLMGADVANSKGYNGAGVHATVVDTGGIRYHPMTTRLIKKSAMYHQIEDENGHGEWCASCLGGVRAEDWGNSERSGQQVLCEGMAPSCTLEEIKALGYLVGTGSNSSLLRALNMAMEDGSDVVSCSWGGPSTTSTPQDDPFYTAYSVMTAAGIVIATAAGNSGPNPSTIDSPGAMPDALTVGAFNPLDTKYGAAGTVASFSSRGPTNWNDVKPDCVAPGVSIDSGITGVLDLDGDYRKNDYSPISGTCLPADTEIGSAKIIELLAGDVVPWAFGCRDLILAHWYQGERKVLRLSTRTGFSIEATPEHKFLVSSNKGYIWMPLHQLRETQSIAVGMAEGSYPLEQGQDYWAESATLQGDEREVVGPYIQEQNDWRRIPTGGIWRGKPVLRQTPHGRSQAETFQGEKGEASDVRQEECSNGDVTCQGRDTRVRKTNGSRRLSRSASPSLSPGARHHSDQGREGIRCGSRPCPQEGQIREPDLLRRYPLQTDAISKIQTAGIKKVYDITTLSHNFVANGIIVHNSMATPHVAGLVALAKQLYKSKGLPNLTTGEIKSMLSSLGANQPKDNDQGWGRLSWSLFEEWLGTQYGITI